MMSFPQFNPAQLQLLAQAQQAAAQQATALKENNEMNQEAVRYLAASGPLFAGLPGFPGAMPNGDAFRAALAQSGLPFPVMYPGMQPDFKPEMLSAGGGPMAGLFFDGSLGFHPYGGGLDGGRRKNATRETTAPLKQWLHDHKRNPYPNKGEKVMLAMVTKMTLTQVSTWFANARRRLKKENKMTWSPRNRPGEDDDDDLADLDNLDTTERPSSSTSDVSLGPLGMPNGILPSGAGSRKREHGDDGEHRDTENNNTDNDQKPSPSPSTESESPKKSKIWSIADMSEKKNETKDEHDEEVAGSSKKDSPSSEETPQLPPNPLLAWQQQFLAMSRMGMPGFPMMGPRPGPPAGMPAGLPPGFAPFFNPMLLAGLQQQAAAAQQAAQLNGSWSEGQSLSPSSSNHSAVAQPEEVANEVA